ncbi:hypothetical protein [Alteribacter aurantiacus]|uniref:hypothetical protein n=1 Tax=Alteribacter aurantiacus TaxID=254410 RepID=UPI0003FA683C|nr:hypothetical protein [Alteribacter aurantiacus]
MKTFGIILIILATFLLLPLHYLAIFPFLENFQFSRLLLILVVCASFLAAILTAGYNSNPD